MQSPSRTLEVWVRKRQGNCQRVRADMIRRHCDCAPGRLKLIADCSRRRTSARFAILVDRGLRDDWGRIRPRWNVNCSSGNWGHLGLSAHDSPPRDNDKLT